MGKGKQESLIEVLDNDLKLKKRLKQVTYAMLPIFLVHFIERFVRGRLFVKFYNLSGYAMGKFLQHHCFCIQGVDTYNRQDFYTMIRDNDPEDTTFSSSVLIRSLMGGSIFISKNKNIIFAVGENKRKQKRNKKSPIGFSVRYTIGASDDSDSPAIYIIGLNFKKDLDILRRYLSEEDNLETHHIAIGSLHRMKSRIQIKPRDLIFSDQLDELYEKVDQILYKFKISQKFMIGANSAIILYGKPGTGKSILAKAVAAHVADMLPSNVDIRCITKSELGKDKLTTILADTTPCNNDESNIIIIDDCDSLMRPRGKSSEDNEKQNITTDLMYLLDNGIPGAQTPLLIILTTNFIDKIDTAILRAGRTDVCIEIKGISMETAKRMCDHYGVSLNDIIEKFPNIIDEDDLINPAKLQQNIIDILSHA